MTSRRSILFGALFVTLAAAGGAEPLRERASYKSDENLYTLHWLPDGRTIALEASNHLKLIDADTGTQWHSFTIGTNVWRAGKPPFALSADGTHLATLDFTEKTPSAIHIWDLATGKEIRRLRGHKGETTALAFSPDGRTLASGGEDWLVRIWELAGGQERVQLKGHTLKAGGYHAAGISSLAFSPDGRLLASAGAEPPIPAGMIQLDESAEFILWDLAKQAKRGEFKVKPAAWAKIEWRGDGKSLRLGWGGSQVDRDAAVMDAATGQHDKAPPGEAHVLARAPDGAILVVGEKSRFDK